MCAKKLVPRISIVELNFLEIRYSPIFSKILSAFAHKTKQNSNFVWIINLTTTEFIGKKTIFGLQLLLPGM